MEDAPAALTPEEERLFAVHDAAWDFAKKCRAVEEHTPALSPTSLDDLVNFLMTEFWDNGFSQDEIRQAFELAVADMSRYAAGETRRGTGIRGTSLLRH